MRFLAIEKYIERLLNESTPQCPVWNVEHIRQGGKAKWNYIDGCMIKAVLEIYNITKEEKYLEFADNFISSYVNDDGSIKEYKIEEYNLDNINEGKVLFPLYDLTGKEKYKKATDILYEQLKRQPRTYEGSFWHKVIYPDQVWLDGLYMAQPFYMEWELRNNGGKNICDIINQFLTVEKRMKDKESGLYFHAYDASKKMFWCDRQTGLSTNFWLRALGWFMMALVDTRELLTDKYENEKKQLNNILRGLSEALINYQHESGMWYQLPEKQDLQGNYLETSGSAIIAYAMMKAVRLGILSEKFKIAGRKAFNGIAEKYLSEDDGKMSLGGICLVAGLGGKEMRDGSEKYYLSEPVVKDEAKGVAPFLLAYTEIMRMDKSEDLR